jgi:hypothetical protein
MKSKIMRVVYTRDSQNAYGGCYVAYKKIKNKMIDYSS